MNNNKKQTKCCLVERVCAMCGNMFIPAPLHLYKNPKTHEKYCGWSCYRDAQKKFPSDFMNNKRSIKD